MKKALGSITLMKRKYAITCFCTLFGALIAIKTGSNLESWTLFAVSMIGAFGIADVADKKLNGGTYNEQEQNGSQKEIVPGPSQGENR